MYRSYFLCSFCFHAMYDSIPRKKKWVLNILGALARISNNIRLTTLAFPNSGVHAHTQRLLLRCLSFFCSLLQYAADDADAQKPEECPSNTHSLPASESGLLEECTWTSPAALPSKEYTMSVLETTCIIRQFCSYEQSDFSLQHWIVSFKTMNIYALWYLDRLIDPSVTSVGQCSVVQFKMPFSSFSCQKQPPIAASMLKAFVLTWK